MLVFNLLRNLLFFWRYAGAVVASYLMDKQGRKKLLMTSFSGMVCSQGHKPFGMVSGLLLVLRKPGPKATLSLAGDVFGSAWSYL
jgi:hypothetical protein